MISSKFWASAVLWLLLALPVAYSQTSDILRSKPKWEFGLRSGAGFDLIFPGGGNSGTTVVISGGNNVRYNNSARRAELYLGVYATRNFGQKWSARSELSVVSKTYEGMSASLGVFPRYQLTNWLKLETGFEHRLPLNIWGRSESRFSVGAVFSRKDMEFNMRFAPGYQGPSAYNKSTWLGSFQAGASFRLASVGKVFK